MKMGRIAGLIRSPVAWEVGRTAAWPVRRRCLVAGGGFVPGGLVRALPCGALTAVNAKTPPFRVGFLVLQGSLTITYFHTGIRTIIGVESFHGPVRDGKGWYRHAMVIRHDLLSC